LEDFLDSFSLVLLVRDGFLLDSSILLAFLLVLEDFLVGFFSCVREDLLANSSPFDLLARDDFLASSLPFDLLTWEEFLAESSSLIGSNPFFFGTRDDLSDRKYDLLILNYIYDFSHDCQLPKS